jgi:hypothetical protein
VALVREHVIHEEMLCPAESPQCREYHPEEVGFQEAAEACQGPYILDVIPDHAFTSGVPLSQSVNSFSL